VSRFAVYHNDSPGSREEFPFLVDIQADLLEDMGTRVVIPLGKAEGLTGFPMLYLIPTVAFQGRPYALLTPQLGGIRREELGPQAGTLADQERVISAAIEFLLWGF
jgi:toxin CcdB